MSRERLQFKAQTVLKADLFGEIQFGEFSANNGETQLATRRDLGPASWWLRPIAHLLARREAKALTQLEQRPHRGLPRFLGKAPRGHYRSWIPGRPLGSGAPPERRWFQEARVLLRHMHRGGITHNDTHKEANWIILEDGGCGLLDFQLASRHGKRNGWFRMLALEDHRHLLKHKKKYQRALVLPSEWKLLRRKSWPARAWRRTLKPPYRWFTRRVLNWSDDEGRGHLHRNQRDA